MSENSLKDEIKYVKMKHNGTGLHGGPHDTDRYADLGERELPKNAAVQLADGTGYSVERYTPVGFSHPDLDELEEIHE